MDGSINQSVMTSYDNIVESIDDDPPSHICEMVREQYKTKKHLPTIINGIKKESPSLSSCNSPVKSISPLRRLSAIIYTPTVEYTNNNKV